MPGKTTKKTTTKKTVKASKQTSTKKTAAAAAPKTTTTVAKKSGGKPVAKKAAAPAKAAPAKRLPAKASAAKASSAKASSAKSTRRSKTAVGATSSEAMTASQKIDEKIASLGDWRGERLAQIRRMIHEVDPEVVEEWKWMGTPVWSHDGMFANANPFKDKVKITFHHGAHLKDPGRLFNNGLGGNKWRAIDLREGDELNPTKFKALIREAIAYNCSHDVPRSKGSRASLLK